MSQRAQCLGSEAGPWVQPALVSTMRLKLTELFSEDLKSQLKLIGPTHVSIFIFNILMVLETLSKKIFIHFLI